MKNFEKRLGLSLDMGTFYVESPDLAGSVARLRIGLPGQPALLELLSSSPPASPALFTWSEVSAGRWALRIGLTKAQMATLGGTKGQRWYVADVITASGQEAEIEEAEGSIYLEATILAAAS